MENNSECKNFFKNETEEKRKEEFNKKLIKVINFLENQKEIDNSTITK